MALVRRLVPVVAQYDDLPYVFFGHSVGALIGFELAHQLADKNIPGPCRLFVSACRAPNRLVFERLTYSLPDELFIAEIERLNGTPKEVLDNAELMALVLPTLRADFEMYETYDFRRLAPLHCPIHAFGGIDDPEVTKADLIGWQEQTEGAFTVSMLPGNHFFLSQSAEPLLSAVGDFLSGRQTNRLASA